jgi:putative flavoprotein involved in K+ transport
VNARTQTENGKPPGDVTCIVIGAGQAGLAVSRSLSERGVDHLVLERGEIANTWRTERWDSLRLLTPNWQCQLPGYAYSGNEPDGYMSVAQLVRFFDDYAKHIQAPVYTGTEVLEVSPAEGGYELRSNRGSWHCQTVVLASGAYNAAIIPACSEGVPPAVDSITASHYRGPAQLKRGGVLVVGASATGLQLAREIQQSGRPVTLSVGEHVRMPRRYRGRDILSWMDQTGLLDESYTDVDDIRRARRVPSPQLVGSENGENLDLNTLVSNGVRLVGRLAGIHDNTLQFSGSLRNVCKLADLKMNRLLKGIDDWIRDAGLNCDVPEAESFADTRVPVDSPLELNFADGDIQTVIWACGFRPEYKWLNVPVLDRKGHLVHDGGVTAAPGLYAMGLPYMRRRKSGFIYGVSDDARDICEHLGNYVERAEGKCHPSTISKTGKAVLNWRALSTDATNQPEMQQ